MPSEYDEPATLPSGYGSMRGSSIQYKAAQLRRTPNLSYTKSIRGIGSSIAERRNMTIYFAFIVAICSINLAITVYLVISVESKMSSNAQRPMLPIVPGKGKGDNDLEQVISSTNTMLHALTYTLPQVLTSNKHAIVTRLNHLVYEIKEIVKLNSIDFNVRFNTNKSVVLKTGSQHKQLRPSYPPDVPTSQPIKLVPVTVSTRKNPFTSDNLPFKYLAADKQFDEAIEKIKRLNTRHRKSQEELNEDYAIFNPIM
ncbi:transmembrane protein [Longquan Niviventer fulvescens jeilongvirus 2]|uniref:Transmembrane protein n=1 Tax=Longquan Niviventer fulvescens jeilongvirus 2 TaxID=2877482 RepID=A0AAE9BUL1_9MONO|nr:transmembrane protein [Longquan Niviventer fulvescens jeilongvirus 2]